MSAGATNPNSIVKFDRVVLNTKEEISEEINSKVENFKILNCANTNFGIVIKTVNVYLPPKRINFTWMTLTDC